MTNPNYNLINRKGPEFVNSLFDVYGLSPLVDCFMHKQNARKINTFETLVTHPSIITLPAINAQSKYFLFKIL
jgi:hypothetical protein